jgi:hypothetical protein
MSDQQSPAAADPAGTPAMPDGNSPAAAPAAPPKQGVSPARNAIGLIALLAVVTVGVLQYTAMGKFNATVNSLNARMDDENRDLMPQEEAEALIGRAPDDAGSDFHEGTATYTRKTYTWWAPLKSYTLAAYYTRGTPPALHHTESEGAKFVREETAAPPAPAPAAGTGGGAPAPSKSRTRGKKSAEAKGPGMPKAEAKGEEKPKAEAKGEEKPKAEESSKATDKPPAEAKAETEESSKTPSKP